MLHAAEKWSLGRSFAGLLAATLPQFLYRGVQKNYRHAREFQQFGVGRLDKGATAQCDYARLVMNSLEHVLQRAAFGASECRLTGLAEYLGYRTAFAALDTIVKIFKNPIQPAPQGRAYTALARTHKAHQEHGFGRRSTRRLRRTGPHTRACAHRLGRTLIQTVQALSALFCRAVPEVDFTIEAAQHHGR